MSASPTVPAAGIPEGPLFTARILADPYPLYRQLRDAAPYHYDPYSGEVILTRYADVVAALKHPALSSRRVGEQALPMPSFLRRLMRPASRILSSQMLFSDPPDHTRLRGLVSRAFTPRLVEGLRPRVEALADELLDAMERRPTPDLVRDYGVWLPLLVIAEMLGVPTRDRARFKTWSDDLGLFIGGTTLPLPVVMARALRGMIGLRAYFQRLVARRRREPPREDLLGHLLAVEEQGDVLTEEELVANCMLVLAAGHETTTNLIGNGAFALLRCPDQLALLRREPERLPAAVEELLRWDSPVQWTGRVVMEELRINGHPLAAGQRVAIGLGAANRDPAQFPDPDRLDITRPDVRPVAFGHGIHYCLGAALARLEGQVGLGRLLARYPGLSLAAGQVHWHANFTLRGLKALPVRLG